MDIIEQSTKHSNWNLIQMPENLQRFKILNVIQVLNTAVMQLHKSRCLYVTPFLKLDH